MAEWTHLEDMEKELYVDDTHVEYEGYFSYEELLRLIDDWAKKYDYYKEVKSHKEKITPHGRNVSMGLDFHRKFSHIHYSFITVEIEIEDMADHYLELDGIRTKVNEGEVEVAFNGYLYTHLKGRWETKPNVAFVRKVIDKFIYKLERSKYPGTVVGETMDLVHQIRAFLNLYKHRIKEPAHGHGGHAAEDGRHGGKGHGPGDEKKEKAEHKEEKKENGKKKDEEAFPTEIEETE